MSAFRDLEQTGWTRSASEYDVSFARLTSQSIKPMLDELAVAPGMRLLDVACGPGYVSAQAAQRGARVTGVDFSPTMIAIARERNPAITFQEGDAEALAFADGSFDVVTMNFGLLHLDRPEKALAEVARVLVPGGRFAFTVWAPADQSKAFGIVLGAIGKLGRTDVPLPPGPPFFQFSDFATSQRALETAGFGDVKIQVVPQTWRFERAGDLFECMVRGTVRTAALLGAQTPEAREAIQREVTQGTQAFARDGKIELPMPCVLATARRS